MVPGGPVAAAIQQRTPPPKGICPGFEAVCQKAVRKAAGLLTGERKCRNRQGPRPGGKAGDKEHKVLDVIYIGLTIVVFAALWLLVKGVERFER